MKSESVPIPQPKEELTSPRVVSVKQIVYELSRESNPVEIKEQSKEVEDKTDWINHLLKTLETPMYTTRGFKSFVNSLKAEFSQEIKNQLYDYRQFSKDIDTSSIKKTYLIELNPSDKTINTEDRYKRLSSLVSLWFKEKDESSKISYSAESSTSIKGLKVIFTKTYKNQEYSLTIEYLYDSKNSAPVLFTNYVYYSDSNWWRGGYYQAEGGQGWQKHIGKTDYQVMGNPNSSINLSFVDAFTKGDWEGLTRWWKLLSKCSEEKYCRQSLTDIKSTYIQLPENYYRDKKLDKYAGEFHPLVLLWNEMSIAR